MDGKGISRRDFLKIAGATAAAVATNTRAEGISTQAPQTITSTNAFGILGENPRAVAQNNALPSWLLDGITSTSSELIPADMPVYANGAPIFATHAVIAGLNDTNIIAGNIGAQRYPFDYTRLFPDGYYSDNWRMYGVFPSGQSIQNDSGNEALLGPLNHTNDIAPQQLDYNVNGTIPDPLRPMDILPILVPGPEIAMPIAEDYKRSIHLIALGIERFLGPVFNHLGKKGVVQLLKPIAYIAPDSGRDSYDIPNEFDLAYRELFKALRGRLTNDPYDTSFTNNMFVSMRLYREKYGRQLMPLIIGSGTLLYQRQQSVLSELASGVAYYFGAGFIKFGTIRTSTHDGDDISGTIWGHEQGHAWGAGHAFEAIYNSGVRWTPLGQPLSDQLVKDKDIMGYYADWDEWLNHSRRELLPQHAEHLFGAKVAGQELTEVYQIKFQEKPYSSTSTDVLRIKLSSRAAIYPEAMWAEGANSIVPVRPFMTIKQNDENIAIALDDWSNIYKMASGYESAFSMNAVDNINALVPKGQKMTLNFGTYSELSDSESVELTVPGDAPKLSLVKKSEDSTKWIFSGKENYPKYRIGVIPLDQQIDQMLVPSIADFFESGEIVIPKTLEKYPDGKYAVVINGQRLTADQKVNSQFNSIIITIKNGKVSIISQIESGAEDRIYMPLVTR
jgi:hypothetical protein